MHVEPGSVELLQALGLGFAFSGLISSGYELLAGRPLGVRLLEGGGWPALGLIPILIFSAPAIIIRSTIRGRRFDHRPIAAVVVAGALAGFWSILCGRLILDAAVLVMAA